MEPIRPDEDELRAARPEQNKEPKAEKARAKPKQKPVAGGGGGSGGSSRALWLALLVLAGAGWWQQQQTLQAMEEQLEEADYWARQSKLALARFEGELSETGETLEQREQTLSETLEEQAESLDEAHSEIRKLWGIAYDRNRKRLDSNEEAIAGLQEKVGSLDETVPELEQRVSGVVEQTDTNTGRLDDLSDEAEQLVASVSALEENLAGVNEQLAKVESSVERQLQRFGREQKLTLDGLDSRIGAIESQLDDLPSAERLTAMQTELDELSQVVAQLTSRLVRLSEQVDALRSGQ